jgi:hypothetical protein
VFGLAMQHLANMYAFSQDPRYSMDN